MVPSYLSSTQLNRNNQARTSNRFKLPVFVSGIALLTATIIFSRTDAASKTISTTLNSSFSPLVDVVRSTQGLFPNNTVFISIWTEQNIFSLIIDATVVVLMIFLWKIFKNHNIYLLSFATFKPPESWKVSHDQIIEIMKNYHCFTQDSLDFMRRMLERNGTGQSTAFPPGLVQCLRGEKLDWSIEASRKEAKTIIFDIVQEALNKAHLSPKDVDVLVINCSLFSPTPSLCAMVINHFHMKDDIQSYNLSGMGCAASLVAVDLARNILQAKFKNPLRGGKALIVSTEVTTPNVYQGNDRAFLVQNTLFRCGGAAIILSSSWMDGSRALFKLLHLVRVQGASDEAYTCVYESEDSEGYRGIRLSKDVVRVAGKTLEKNLMTLGPFILPISEKMKVVFSVAVRFLLKNIAKIIQSKQLPMFKMYVPDFTRGIEHFCIHAGGRAVIDGIEQNMRLELFHTEPSKMTLNTYGNTSSSSIWYELEYIIENQKTNPLKKGHRVMQVAFGAGFKCTSGVWQKL